MYEWNARDLRVDRDGISVFAEDVEICRLAPRALVDLLDDDGSGWLRTVEDADAGAFDFRETGAAGARLASARFVQRVGRKNVLSGQGYGGLPLLGARARPGSGQQDPLFPRQRVLSGLRRPAAG